MPAVRLFWLVHRTAPAEWFQLYSHSGIDGIVGDETGTELLWWGDPYYNGTSDSSPGYCFWYLPGSFKYLD